MDQSEGLFELSLINAEKSGYSFEDFYLWGTEKGIPAEVLTRLKSVWNLTKKIAGEVISIGKVIVSSILDFLKAHPKLTAGILVGAAITVLISSIPFLGPILGPVSAALVPVYGAGVGAAIEGGERIADATNPVVAAVALARSFFDLLISIFQAVSGYFRNDGGHEA